MSNLISQQFSYGKVGQGFDGKIMTSQAHCNINFFKDHIFSALESIPVSNKDRPLFTIGDFGAADGSSSMPLMTDLIERIRKKHGEIPIQIVYEDQPCSDFNSLFRQLHGLIADPPTYLKRFKQVYTMACGTSFFDQVLPDDTAHLIMSFGAAHYLSKLPTKYQNSLHRYPDATEEERQLVGAQAAKDWETFLLQRARELKSGGMLIVMTPCEDPEMKIGGIRHCSQGFEEGMLNAWRQMRAEGKITQEEFLDTNFQRCTRYLHEMTAPLEDPNSKVYKAGLRLFQAEMVLTPCVFQKQCQKKLDEEGVDDRASWVKAVVSRDRLWSNNIFLQGLASARREHEKEALVNELYERLEKDILAQGPKEFKNGYLLNYVCIHKI